jgi:molybdopterin-biosynthesis enzyme MoeA-like protein
MRPHHTPQRNTRLRVRLLLLSLTAFAAAACSSTGLFYDPVFASVGSARSSEATCPEGRTCIEVPLTAIASAAGETGTCAVYTTPGDPATMEPLAAETVQVPSPATDELEIAFVWEITIPGLVELAALNPVCTPMVEG